MPGDVSLKKPLLKNFSSSLNKRRHNHIIDPWDFCRQVNVGIAQRIHSTLMEQRARSCSVAYALRIKYRKNLHSTYK